MCGRPVVFKKIKMKSLHKTENLNTNLGRNFEIGMKI